MASKAIKFGKQLKELRFHFCQTNQSSQGVRNFIQNSYVPLKKANPTFPMLIRECSEVEPIVFARYEFGRETSFSLRDLNEDNIFEVVSELAADSSKS